MKPKKRRAGRPSGTFVGKYPTTFGGKQTTLYLRWKSMIYRTKNACDRWTGKEGFSNFVDDMGSPPKGMVLGRKDVSRPHSLENSRWVTPKEQASERSRPGPKPNPKTLHRKAQIAGLSPSAVYFRVKKLGWSEKKALSTPVKTRKTG